MKDLVIYSLSAFIISTLLFPLFIRMLKRWDLYDPRDAHKIHDRDVPTLGGIAVVLSGILIIFFYMPWEVISEFKFLIGSLFIMFVAGLRDDILPLTPWVKIVGQLIPCIIVFFTFDIQLNSFYSLWDISIHWLPALLLTCFTIIIITNSFNLIDGIDGLAGSLSIISLSVFAVELHLSGNENFSYLIAAFIGAQLGFLIFNWAPAKIFMGDTGALFYGFLLSCAAIIFINSNYHHPNSSFSGTVATAMCFLGVPLFDTFRIILHRIKSGRSPLSADQDHIHHMLLKLGLNHSQITLSFVSVQILVVAMAYLAKGLNDWILFIMLGILYFGLLYWIKSKLKAKAKKAGV